MQKNIFSVLASHDSDHEESNQKDSAAEKQKRDRKRGTKGGKDEPALAVEEVKKENTHNEKLDDGRGAKGVSEQPHPQDRRSGTGRGKELRKDGGGRNNWGNYQDDIKAENKEYDGTSPTDDAGVPAVPVVPEVPQSTLEEYYKEKGIDFTKDTKAKPQYVRKVDEDDLKKDKLSVLKTKEDLRKEDEATNKKATHKLTPQDLFNKTFSNTQGQEFLKFTTGNVADPVKQQTEDYPKKTRQRNRKTSDDKEQPRQQRRDDQDNVEGAPRRNSDKDQADAQVDNRRNNNEQRGGYRVKQEGGDEPVRDNRGPYKGNRGDGQRDNRGDGQRDNRGEGQRDNRRRNDKQDADDKQVGVDRPQDRDNRPERDNRDNRQQDRGQGNRYGDRKEQGTRDNRKPQNKGFSVNQDDFPTL